MEEEVGATLSELTSHRQRIETKLESSHQVGGNLPEVERIGYTFYTSEYALCVCIN